MCMFFRVVNLQLCCLKDVCACLSSFDQMIQWEFEATDEKKKIVHPNSQNQKTRKIYLVVGITRSFWETVEEKLQVIKAETVIQEIHNTYLLNKLMNKTKSPGWNVSPALLETLLLINLLYMVRFLTRYLMEKVREVVTLLLADDLYSQPSQ